MPEGSQLGEASFLGILSREKGVSLLVLFRSSSCSGRSVMSGWPELDVVVDTKKLAQSDVRFLKQHVKILSTLQSKHGRQ